MATRAANLTRLATSIADDVIRDHVPVVAIKR